MRMPRKILDTLKHTFALYEADAALAGQFRARQIQGVLRLTPLTMFANTLNAGIVAWTLRNTLNPALLLGWIVCILYAAGVGIEAWLKWKRTAAPNSASPRALNRAATHAGLLALLWSAVPVIMLPLGSREAQMMLMTITAGMLCAGGFALATVPKAALTYVSVLGVCSAIGLLRMQHLMAVELALLLTMYMLVVIGSVFSNAKTFGARLMAEAEGERQRQLIGLLLRDFEESISGSGSKHSPHATTWKDGVKKFFEAMGF